jgi:hypothetical protein
MPDKPIKTYRQSKGRGRWIGRDAGMAYVLTIQVGWDVKYLASIRRDMQSDKQTKSQ